MEEAENQDKEEAIKKEKEIKNHDKILKGFFVFVGFVAIVIGAWIFFSYQAAHFDYEGVEYVVTEEVAPYRTTVPVEYQSSITGGAIRQQEYYFYLRKDPRKIGDIEFDGEIKFKKTFVVNATDDLNCEGKGIIGLANLVRLYQVLGAKVIKDPNATCDSLARYGMMQIEKGEETRIEEISPACYKIYVKDCEILEATERFMIEIFSELKNY